MITKSALHAIRAFIYLADLPPKTYAGAGKVAEITNAPRNYLGKLLQQLANEGLLISQKGLNGGFRLAKPADEITLFDIVEPLEHVTRWEECFLGKKECSGKDPCPVHFGYAVVRDSYIRFLKDIVIEDLSKSRYSIDLLSEMAPQFKVS